MEEKESRRPCAFHPLYCNCLVVSYFCVSFGVASLVYYFGVVSLQYDADEVMSWALMHSCVAPFLLAAASVVVVNTISAAHLCSEKKKTKWMPQRMVQTLEQLP